jgi:hypothetical protein
MKFTSLKDAYQNYIQSFPEFTHLDLTPNEIKLIELILSYTRTGGQFYMNYTDIADYLYVSKGKNKAKTVERIVRGLNKAGYIIKETTHNFNGRNGGSSANMRVNEAFLEEQLHKVFNPKPIHIEPVGETIPLEAQNILKADLKSANDSYEELKDLVLPKTFIEELEEMDVLDDDIKYIDTSSASVIVADGIMVKVMGQPDISTTEETEPNSPKLLPIETIKNKLRNIITDDRYHGQQSSIQALLTAFDHKTVEEFNGFYNHILESASKA